MCVSQIATLPVVMLGKRAGTAVRMDKVLGKTLHKSWCNNHRQEILLENGFKKVPGFKQYDAIINMVYTFYGPAQHKKRYIAVRNYKMKSWKCKF